MKKYFNYLILGVALLQFSCKKEYITQEITNIDEGTKILNGTSNPTLSIGKVGDFYLNTTSKALFGPKTESSWGDGVLLSGLNGKEGKDGVNGTNGTNGNTILNGKGAPASSLGIIGDFYLDTENLALYGPKTNTGWGTPVSLKPSNATSNGIRILLKENAKIHEEITGFSSDKNQYSIRLNVGDISKFINEGSVIIQSRINNGGWTDNDIEIVKDTENFELHYHVRIEEGYNYSNNTIILPVTVGMWSPLSLTQSDISNIFSQAKDWINTLNIQFKVTLIPAEKVEKISLKK